MFKRMLSFVLAAVMVFGLFPVGIFAAGDHDHAHTASTENTTVQSTAGVNVTLTADELADYYGIREDGTAGEASTMACTSFIDCTGVETVTLTMVDNQTTYKWGLAFYDAQKQFLSFVEQGSTNSFQYILKTVTVPEGAAYFRTTYYNYAYQKSTGHEFSCVLNYREGFTPTQYRPYQDGYIFFSREVNQSLPEEAPKYKRTTGVLALPENYSAAGEKTKLIVYFHGYSHGVYMDSWGSTDNFRLQKEHFLERGYAVMDCNGARDSDKAAQASNAGASSQQYVDGFWQCYQYVIENYNIDPQVYVVGGSAGGPSAINFADWHSDNVRALMLLAPWTDLEMQCWGQGIRAPFVEYLGFENTTTYEEEKTLEVDPALRIKYKEDGTAYIDSLKVPVRAFVGADDTVVSMHTSLTAFMDALKACQPDAQLKIWEGRGHEIVSGAISEIDDAVCDWFDSIANEELLQDLLSNKNISILGDSISTFKGVTDNGDRNSTITAEYLARYALSTDPDTSLVKLSSVNDTWWMQTINRYGMNLLVNNSWRGTKVLDTGIRSGYGIRSQNLHDDTLADNPGGVSIDPDIIAIHLGTNDYLQSTTVGTFDPSSMTYIRSDGYDTPANFAQAYAIMVHKILQRYPDADVFCFTLSPITYKTDKAALESLNVIIRAVAEHFGLPVVDLYADSGITAENANTYLASDKIHPNEAGIDLITECFNRALAAHYAPKAYQWKPNGSALESLVAGSFEANTATMTQGTITDGAFSDTRFTLEKTVQLLHDYEWSVEWRSSGGWSTATGYSGALLLSQTASSMTADSCYLYRRGGNSFIALGIYQNGSHHNYGVSLSGIDSSVAHTYKLVNRIAPDGSNMVYLFVDGVEIGALNQYYIGGNLQSEASNWISGKDFSFSYMGTAEHPISGCSIEYIRVNEGRTLTLQHSPVAIPGVEATLTKDGLTEGQRCSVCGEILVYQQVVPSMGMALLRELLSGKKLSILGDSISTYNGWTNSNTVNSTLGPSHAVYYYGNNGVGLDDTWWKQVSDQVGLEILVNNAWGGSSVTSVRTDHGLLSYGWNVRPERLHDDTLDNNPGGLPINPDIIAVYMGTNDHTRNVTCNTVFDDDYWAMIEAEGFVPPATTDFDQSCALMIYKICQNYPDADVFILNNPTMSSGTEENRLAYNAAFQAIAAHYGCTVVDLHSTELSNYNTYTIDGRHPNAAGMDIMTEAFIKALIERYVNHTHTPVTDPAVAPTCTETGLTEGSHCSVCGEVIVAQEVMPALGHSLTMKQQNATHYWYKCQRCDVVSEKTAHSGLEKKPMLQYFAIPNNSRACESIVVYLPRENGYLRINFEHMISPNMNYNVWINYQMQACDDNLNHRFWLTNGGAVEAAIRMDGRDDFSGGVAHGDEIDTEFYLEVDGVRVSFAALTELTTFTELKIIRHSTLYDPADHTTEIATHDTEYLLTKDGMKLSQKVKWLVEADCSSSYMAMFPVLRTTTDAAGNPIYISEFFYNDINSTHFDVRESGKKEYPQQWNPGVTKMTLYSNTMGLTHTLEILEMTAVPGSGYGNCSGSESYNKLYFSITGFGEGAAHVAKPGDEWIVVSFLNVEIGQENRCYYGHTAVTDPAVAPTCTTTGLTEGSHCNVCGEILVAQTEIPATGHSFGAWTQTQAPTCTEKGSERRGCVNCDHYEIRDVAATGHSHTAVVTSPTCTEQGYTTYTCHCGDSYVADYVKATGHSFGNWAETKAPTCTEKGQERRDCANCDHYETRDVAATGHSHTAVVTSPTCTEQGYTTYTCHCGDSYVDDYVPATGHSYGDWVTIVEPTEETEGKAERTCSACGHKETKTLPVLSHTHRYDAVVTAPTCTEQGYTTHTCRCGDSYVDAYVPATGHKFGAWTQTKAPTCTEKGSERRDCANCDHYEIRDIAATGHSHTAVVTKPTCTTQGYTTYTCHCGDTYVDSYVPATGHSFGNWVTIVEPTEETEGKAERTCSACGHKETKTLPVLSHTHRYDAVVTAPTCTEQGYTTYTCHCGDSYVDDYVPATGHSFGVWTQTKAPTCTEKGTERRDCANCDHYETRDVAATGHKHTAVVTKPTCTEQGYTTYTCRCGDSYVDSYVPATGHSYGNWVTIVEPTEETEGKAERTCSACGHKETKTLPVLSHTHRYDAVVTAPTCTEQGYITHTCRCGDSYVDSYVPATGHSFGNWVETKAPTCTEKGTERRDCANCDHYETRDVAATGHSHTAVVTKPTCTEQGYTTYTCHCGDSYVDSYVPATGHSYGNWVETKAPTCTEKGEETRTCHCGQTEKREIKATGHHFENGVCTGCGQEEKTYVLGDVNGDGRINVLDAGLIVSYYTGVKALDETQQLAADVNGDGRINVLDAGLIVSFYTGVITAFPAEQ